jgi:3-hydroxyisobutyrate dehydrogenase-like beta-hydroxyacid dehydrogenase
VTKDSASPVRVTVLGLGEAGAALAADLVAHGASVFGWDPDTSRTVPGVERTSQPGAAVAAAEVVLSVNSQAAAVEAAREVCPALTAAHLYADLNTTSAVVKRAVAAATAPSGAAFADVALLAPVPGRGVRTPCLASGPGRRRFAEVFAPMGMPIEMLGEEPGEAATRKLLRSIFMKGLAAAVIESLATAAAAGCEDWLRAEIGATLAGADAGLVDRLVSGSVTHARRRIDEMEAAAALELDLDLEPYVAVAAADVLRKLAQAADR